MKTMNELSAVVRQTAYEIHVSFGSYRFRIRKFIFNNGRAAEDGPGKLTCFFSFVSAFSAFFVAK